jgi:hypothetical protein
MKKIFLTLIVVMLVAAGVMGQSQVGIRGGLHSATVDANPMILGTEEPWRTGFIMGIASQFWAGEVFSFAPELMYEQRGFSQEFTGGVERVARFDYVSVPLLFRLTFGRTMRAYVNAGPTISYWLGGTQRAGVIADMGIDQEYNEEIRFGVADGDWTYDASRFELGGAVGGGLMLDTEGGTFLIDIRYTQGFTNIADVQDTEGYKNQGISISMIYLLPSLRSRADIRPAGPGTGF